MPNNAAICLIASLALFALGASASPLQQVLQSPALSCQPLPPGFGAAEQTALAALYQTREAHPRWSDEAQQARLWQAFDTLADDGLQPAEYTAGGLRDRLRSSDPLEQACAELATSHAYLSALRHLREGRLEQREVEPLWRQNGALATDWPTLVALAGEADPLRAFERARPALAQYRNLRLAYARLRREPLGEWLALPAGPLLRPGAEDSRVPLLAERLRMAGYLAPAAPGAAPALRYDAPLAEALRAYQRDHGLQDDGILGPATLHELNISPASRLNQLRANLERWRWLARDMEPDLLLVDIAGARLTLYRDARAVWETRAQVGRASRATPLLKSTITRLTLNPTWTVPPTIFREDKLPQIRRDPDYLARQGLQVLDLRGQPLDPAEVDWDAPGGILLRQQAGPSNPLGQVAVRFANPFLVYLHDTPSQRQFGDTERATSSGCVRVEAALGLVDKLLTDAERDLVARRLASGQTYEYRLGQPMPLLLGYWTAEADEQGKPSYRQDLYRRDAALIAAINRIVTPAGSDSR